MNTNYNNPYVFHLTNNTAETKKIALFGFAHFFTNVYTDDLKIELHSSFANKSYMPALAESALFPFSTKKIKLTSTNISQLMCEMRWEFRSAKGNSMSIPINTKMAYDSAKERVNANVNDIAFDEPFYINALSYFEFSILANTTLTVYVFPEYMTVSAAEPKKEPEGFFSKTIRTLKLWYYKIIYGINPDDL